MEKKQQLTSKRAKKQKEFSIIGKLDSENSSEDEDYVPNDASVDSNTNNKSKNKGKIIRMTQLLYIYIYIYIGGNI